MDESLRAQVYETLKQKETEDLLLIWRDKNFNEYEPETFDIIRQILSERLGNSFDLTTTGSDINREDWLESIYQYLESGNLNKALSECELLIQANPDFADAYNCRGAVFEELEQVENALSDYRKAIQLNPDFEAAWENLEISEEIADEEFQDSPVKKRLDKAIELIYEDEFEKALQETMLVKQSLPAIASAHNYTGLIFHELEEYEGAIEMYLEAIALNPRYYAARNNLADARLKFEEQQYRLEVWGADTDKPAEANSLGFTKIKFEDITEQEVTLPGWVYMDRKSYLLIGWPGYRHRPGRSGYDPLETRFEFAHMFSYLLEGKVQFHNPLHYFFIIVVTSIYSIPILLIVTGFNPNEWISVFLLTLPVSLYGIGGVMALINTFKIILKLTAVSKNNGDDNRTIADKHKD